MISIAFIILFITKGYNTSVKIIYKCFSRVKDIIVLKLFKVTKEIAGFY